MKITTIKPLPNKQYRINNPGTGRIGSKLNTGTPYEKKLLVDAYQQKLSGTAFDVGAHIGNHALYFAAICGFKVQAWEPHEKSLAMLRDNIALNPDLNISVHPWAAGNSHTTGRFSYGMWLSFDPDRDGAQLIPDHGEVEVRPIDSIGIVSDLALVKIDVEGMEAQVLEGMVENLKVNQPVIYTEAHTEEDLETIREVIGPLGYEIGRILQMGSRQVRWNNKTRPTR